MSTDNHELRDVATGRELYVAHVSATDIQGGAARGAYSLHRALRDLGVKSELFVGKKLSSDPTVYGPMNARQIALGELRAALDSKLLGLLGCAPGSPLTPFTSHLVGSNVPRTIRRHRADIIHLHYLDRGLVHIGQIAAVARQKPVVWTLRSMGAFTGGCELDDGCGRFRENCGYCPIIQSKRPRDITRMNMWRKHRAWRGKKIYLVALSQWIRDQARRSSLFENAAIPVINPGIDLDAFRPIDQTVARQALRLPLGRKIITFSSLSSVTQHHKGWQEFIRALGRLVSGDGDLASRLLVLLVGLDKWAVDAARLPLETISLGPLRDQASLSLAYNAGDVLAVPSRQETFGKVAAESLACGTPVVAFDDTGLADIVEHRRNGYLADFGSVEDFSAGLDWVLADSRRLETLRQQAHESARRFSRESEALAYRDLYRKILAGEIPPSVLRP